MQASWVQPKFRPIFAALDVDVRGLEAVTSKEKEPIWSEAEYGWHLSFKLAKLDQMLFRNNRCTQEGK
jgi:hypothetical protein